MITLKPLVEMFPWKGEPPWEIATFPKGHFLPISEHLSLPEIGAVVALLMSYNRQATLDDVIAAEALVLPGGMGVYVDEDLAIVPGCCCGLECWRGWERFLDTGDAPWCGHDPETDLTRQVNAVKMSHTYGTKMTDLQLNLPEYRKNLIAVEKSLQGFIFALEAWGYAVDFPESRKLATKFDQCFDMKVRW